MIEFIALFLGLISVVGLVLIGRAMLKHLTAIQAAFQYAHNRMSDIETRYDLFEKAIGITSAPEEPKEPSAKIGHIDEPE
jgi:hypothetical protein